jgi:hypothetical protein
MSIGELISAAVVDERVWDAYQETAPDGVYLVGPPGRTLYRWGPEVRRMRGAMDLTTEVDRIDDAVLDETGTFVASFILEGEVLGEIEFPVYVQAAAQKLPKETEEGLRKSDVIWVGTRVNGHKRMAPVWFAYKEGKVYVLSSRDPDLQEQQVPGVPDAQELVVVTRRKGRDTSLEEFSAAQRLLEGPEWENAAKMLVDRRRSRVGPPQDSLARWRGKVDIVELTPNVASLETGG